MKNAHERFGWLEFEKQLKDTRTRLRVALDRFIVSFRQSCVAAPGRQV